MSQTFKPGDRVFYQRPHMIRSQKGIVKSAAPVPDHYFVVYSCAGDWEHYRDYTGQLSDSKFLSPGWPEINADDTEF